MKSEALQSAREHPAGRVQLRGTVAGAVACELVADRDEIVVGSDLACDLPVMDPVMPPRAFRLHRIKYHATTGKECRCHWLLESTSRARIYVNQQITRRERLHYGDIIESGCHQFEFTQAGCATRNTRFHQNVADLCERLLAKNALAAGFIKNSPFYGHKRRRRRAMSIAGIFAALLVMLALLIPRKEQFESVMPPLEIEVVDTTMVSPDAVRSLDSVTRQEFQPTEAPPDSPELAENPVIPLPDKEVQPRLRDVAEVEAPKLEEKPVELARLEPLQLPIEPPTETEIERIETQLEPTAAQPRREIASTAAAVEGAKLADYKPARTEVAAVRRARPMTAPAKPDMPTASKDPKTWQLPILPPTTVKTADTTVQRETAKLSGSRPPVRRLSVSETVKMAEAGSMAALRKVVRRPASGPVTRAAVRDVLATLKKPTADGLKGDPSRAFEQLAAYKASPVGFESFRGMRVPVVRMSEQLEQIAPTVATAAIALDGTVSKDEIAISWKSGQFHAHAPGQPKAKPPTYCYVGKTKINGKQCLYIAFTCVDPDVSKIRTRGRSGDCPSLIGEDSVEIFLDTNGDRKDYYQLIANAKGAYWSGYYPKPAFEGKIATPSQAWNAGATIKTSVTREPGQWVCEIAIPFDRLGGVPAKGSRWAVNFARNYRGQKEDWQLQSWFAVYDKGRNFHHPSLFGIFQW